MKSPAGKRILMIVENNSYPGDPRVRREAVALTSAGYRVSVIAPKDPKEPWREEVEGVSVFRFPTPPEVDGILGFFWEYSLAFLEIFVLSFVVLFTRGFDVIHVHNPPDIFVVLAILYRPFGKKFVFDHHDLAPEMYMARFGEDGKKVIFDLLVFFEKWSCKLADRVIATNESYKAMEMARSGLPAEKVTVVRNGPDLKRLYSVAPDPALRAKDKMILGYLGVMGFQDGLDYFLRAAHHLIHDLGRKDFYAVLMGDGDAWDSLQALNHELGLEDYVWFVGHVSGHDLLKYLSSTDICLCPDPYNAYNDRSTMIKLTEYMALAKPIVAFDLHEHRVTAQQAAVYAERNNELDFAHKIAALMDDPQQRQRMGQLGRTRVEQQLSWDHQKQNLIDTYRIMTQTTSAEEVISEQKLSS